MKKLILVSLLSLFLSVNVDAATNFGANATRRDNQTPTAKISVNEDQGRMRIAYDEFTLTGELTANDTIRMAKLPLGSKVYEVILHSPQLGTGDTNGTLSAGIEANGVDSADTTLFIGLTEAGSAAVNATMSDTQGGGNSFEPGAETQVIVHVGETTDAGIGDTIKLWIYYVLD